MRSREIVVHGGAAGLTQEVEIGPHTLVADEPIALGGGDLGPNPYDLLCAALGTCTSMTLQLFARRKGWPLDGVTVRVYHERVHAVDCADCETREGKVDHLHRELELQGPLTDEQRQRLLEIAERCPVHRTLTSEIVIRTRLSAT